MKFKYFRNYSNDVIKVPYLDNGHALCPICGADMNGFEPYYGDRDPSEEICPDCNTQFGDDDSPSRSEGDMPTEEYFNRLRARWLDRHSWDESLLNRLRVVLSVDIEKLIELTNLQ